MTKNYFKSGDWNAQCDICGRKRKRSQCKKTWDGYVACTISNCWYPKHANDIPIPVNKSEMQPVPDARPISTNYVFVDVVFGIIWDQVSYNWEDLNIFWEDENYDRQ